MFLLISRELVVDMNLKKKISDPARLPFSPVNTAYPGHSPFLPQNNSRLEPPSHFRPNLTDSLVPKKSQAFNFSPRLSTSISQPLEAITDMSLRNIPGQTGPSSLPHELFLEIIDILITEAEQAAKPLGFFLEYKHASETKVSLADANYVNTPCFPSQRDRFCRFLRIPAQINRKTRSMLKRKFHLLPVQSIRRQNLLGIILETRFMMLGWVHPNIDVFLPRLQHLGRVTTNWDDSPIVDDNYLIAALQLPTPQGHDIVQCLTRIDGWIATRFFHAGEERIGQMLLSLPNLSEVLISAGDSNWLEWTDEPHHHGEFIEIDENQFPHLAEWESANGHVLRAVWPQFQQRGVSMFATEMAGTWEKVLELEITQESILIMFINPVCMCYFHF